MLTGKSNGAHANKKARTAVTSSLRLEELELRTVPAVAWPGESESAWPANWDLGPPFTEIEAKWHVLNEQHFENILAQISPPITNTVSVNGHTYSLSIPWTTPMRFTDIYYDTPTGELAQDQHVLRHRERSGAASGAPNMTMDISALLTANWSSTPDRRLIQYKSTPERFGSVWFREESGNLLDDLTLAEVNAALNGLGYPGREDNPIAEMRNDHPEAEVPYRGQPGGLTGDLMVVAFRYRVVFSEGGVEKFEASFDKVRQYDLVANTFEDFFEIEIEALRDSAGQFPASDLDQLFTIRDWLQGNYAIMPVGPLPAPVSNPPLPNPDTLPTVQPSNESKGGAVVADHGPIVLDDGATARTDLGSWSSTGTWTTTTGGYGGDVRANTTGSGASVWTFDFLSAGRYKVAVTWTADPTNSTSATYEVYNGTTLLGTFTRNQTAAPTGYTVPGSAAVFNTLGDTLTITATGVNNGRLVVKLLANGSGRVVADAVRIQYVDEGAVPALAAPIGGGLYQLIATGTNGTDTIAIGVDGSGYATVNGMRVPKPGAGGGDLTAAEVGSIIAQGVGGNDVIDLSGVTASAFSNLTSTFLAGGDGNDTVIGSEIGDNIHGEGGHDLLSGGAGNDYAEGGVGNDVVLGDTGDDTLYGDFASAYYDSYTGQVGGNDWLDGGSGNDFAYGEWFDDTVIGGTGGDFLFGDWDYSYGGSGPYATGGDDVIDGGSDNDYAYGGEYDDVITGGTGDDVLTGDFGWSLFPPFTAGNDTYVFAGNNLGSDYVIEADDANTDVLDFTNLGGGAFVNIGLAYTFQTVSFGRLSLAFSSATGIENVLGTAFIDSITGNTRDNFLSGGALQDTLSGGAGNDVILGGTQDDNISGGDGNDTIDGGTGDDTISGGIGNDTIDGWTGGDTISGGDGNDVLIGWTGGDTLDGGLGNDTIDGGVANDVLIGGGGNDSLTGGVGSDQYLFSGSASLGSDTIFEAAGTDFDTLDFSALGFGVTVNLSTSTAQTVASNLVLTIQASGIETVFGSGFSDVITGDGGNNTLFGNGGSDTLTGGAGSDNLFGGAGSDWYVFSGSTSLGSDVIFEDDNLDTDSLTFAGLTGASPAAFQLNLNLGTTSTQFVNSLLTLTLSTATGIENVYGTTGNDVLTGNTRYNSIYGGFGNDTLTGDDGDDYLDGTQDADILIGGGGNDTLVGGDGNDTYVFAGSLEDLGSDVISGEAADDDADTLDFAGLWYGITVDLGLAGVSQAVAPILTLTIEPSFITTGLENVVGTPYVDSITGNARPNMLSGGAGQDYLSGLGGSDSLNGGSQDDVIYGGTQDDYLYGDTGEDTIYGEDGNDTLIGYTGHDILYGGAGNDSLTGGTGEDTLEGGAGNDSLVGDTGSDRYVFSGSAALGSDTVTEGDYLAYDVLDFTSFGTGVFISLGYTGAQTVASGKLTLTLSSGVGIEYVYGSAFSDYIYGNSLSNYLVGNGGNDVLVGDYGYDSLDGGIGQDTLIGGEDSDYLYGGDGNDYLYGDSASYTFGASDTIVGGAGHDVAFGEGGSDYILGEDGNDTLYGDYGSLVYDPAYGGLLNPGDDTIYAGIGNDYAYGEAGWDYILGEDGNDTLYGDFDYAPYQFGWWYGGAVFGGGYDTVDGGTGTDLVYGGEFLDTLYGGDGNDTLYGDYGFAPDPFVGLWYNGDDDNISGGNGNDLAYGEWYTDVLYGNAGDDTLYGDFGGAGYGGSYGWYDLLEGGTGNDFQSGDGGGDMYVFNGVEDLGSDILVEADNQDVDILSFTGFGYGIYVDLDVTEPQVVAEGHLTLTLSSSVGFENVNGTAYADVVLGNDRDNTLYGEDGDDLVMGFGGNDMLHGGAGNDSLHGGIGDDWLYGAVGVDELWGGPGTDWLDAGGDPGDTQHQ